ncbi:M23 family metallopeptidase [Altericroceibacterium xinjiangense]|uniref:M23 family metallopeptidase n=1 Tax=Altericroceibacterium xinjiangense TaxID=762261 RepID=UPI000F7F61B4|nr:M23 family metallopeptidase [Altericroceibacterium xinjiangense]
MRLALIAAAVVIALAALVLTVIALDGRNEAEAARLRAREQQTLQAEQRLAAYRQELDALADDLQRRQDFIEQVLPMLPADVKAEDVAEADPAVTKVSAILPEAAALSRLEARQFAFVANLTRYADERSAHTEAAIRQLGLDPKAIVRSSRTAQGGPLERLSTSKDGSIDPKFERLGLALARMDALERGLQGIPQVMPADIRMISSGFGFRHDPFNGHGAMHAGLDFRGATGSPIHAAADGKVSFVGVRGGYGNVVEITHGNGMMTRYAHMSAFKSKVGQTVGAGDVIGLIGSTGRSTGPHLHFEVRIHGRAVNPRPFLENAPQILEEARAA